MDTGTGTEVEIVDRRSAGEWELCWSQGAAGDFHRLSMAELQPAGPDRPHAWVHRVPRTAIVLGSTQDFTLLRSGAETEQGANSQPASPPRPVPEVTRRRSGGGLVMVDPDTDGWVDLVLPRTDHRWHNDIGRSFHWAGRLWQKAIRPLVPAHIPVEVCLEPDPARLQRPLLCFAELGHGEVTVGGRKVLGLSQRRTRDAARIQCLYLGTSHRGRLGAVVDPEAATTAGFSGPLTSTPTAPNRKQGTELLEGMPPVDHPPPISTVVEAFVEALTGSGRVDRLGS